MRAGLNVQGVFRHGAIPIASTVGQFMVVVVGGEGGLHSTFIPSFGNTWSVTRAIRKPHSG